MGTWGTAIFSDDLTSELREDFKEYIGDGLTTEQATAKLIEENRDALTDVDEGPTFWLGLAAIQWSLGRLLPEVRQRAVAIIESGEDLGRWQTEPKLQEKRRQVLEKLRVQLTSPQPAPKKISPRFRSENEWPIDSVVSIRLLSGRYCLFRVTGEHKDRGGAAPQVQFLDWIGDDVPATKTISRLPILKATGYGQPDKFIMCAVAKKDLPRDRVHLVGTIPQDSKPSPMERLKRLVANSQSEPRRLQGGFCIAWRYLDRQLEQFFGLN